MSVYSYVSNTRDIEEKLLKSELDAAVVEGEILSSDLIVLPVIDDSLVLAVGKEASLLYSSGTDCFRSSGAVLFHERIRQRHPAAL